MEEAVFTQIELIRSVVLVENSPQRRLLTLILQP